MSFYAPARGGAEPNWMFGATSAGRVTPQHERAVRYEIHRRLWLTVVMLFG
ncbi:hypothetical protein PPSIR1_15070 [Plesiocystis pacifica SIR-1]|uniref:Uncharacterized protein n=1 Tax=Plesiocystis pacifica SIR-1 TaxID=391625 RepID=A6G6E1_9BACT|nr:hypothetical protein PPSIR1_15070 [Plesiocystis pacifica SIR-1]